ncbi:MAG: GIY-YIG nuclease family protein [Candidatus Pacebacteria bacterium]|jgi:putative endonuclease|nr:GIY-YIG nuclease family protein [Candidatus Paceibacterota bacterium]
MRNKKYYVYIATNKRNIVFYTGIINDVYRRMFEHQSKSSEKSFTKRYNVEKLVYCQEFDSPESAIMAEKEIKGWVRSKKVDLIKTLNPEFRDLLEQ